MDNRCTVMLVLKGESYDRYSDLGYLQMDPALCKPNVIVQYGDDFYMITDSPQFYVGGSGDYHYVEVVHYESVKNVLRQIPGQAYITQYRCLLNKHHAANKTA